MVKKQLISALAAKLPESAKRDSEAIVKHIIEVLSESIARGERIEIRGFGAFSLHQRRAAMIKNPKSGETMMIGEKHKVHFKPGLDLTLKVKKGSEKGPGST